MVSVIVPVYEVERYFDRCIKSILTQTYNTLEIIIVDDGSPDHCSTKCDQWAERDTRIKVVHQKNSGQAAARNAGLDICQGEYVCFVDSDDEIDPNMINILYDAINSGHYDLAICGYQRFRENEKSIHVSMDAASAKALSASELWQEVFGRLNNAVWNKLFRRDLIGDLRFPVGLIHGEDFIFNLYYICKCEQVVMLDVPLYYYFIRPGSITKSEFRESKFDDIKAKDMAMALVQEYQPTQIANAQKYCFRARMNVLRSLYRSRQEKKYPQQVREYKEYTKKYYAEVAQCIRLRERGEYYLLHSAEPIYAWITRMQHSS